MEKVRPYVSVDVESTGLEVLEGHKLLSVGLVLDDGLPDTRIADMKKLHLAVSREAVIGSLYALAMNAELMGVISGYGEAEIEGLTVRTGNVVCDKVDSFMNEAKNLAQAYDRELNLRDEKVQVLAKNGQKLDIPMMDDLFEEFAGSDRSFSSYISHRVMDLGSMYVSKYGRNVSLSLINKELDRPAVAHHALADAEDNVAGFRSLLGFKY